MIPSVAYSRLHECRSCVDFGVQHTDIGRFIQAMRRAPMACHSIKKISVNVTKVHVAHEHLRKAWQ